MSEPPETRDFFVSYTGADRAWAEWIAWTIEEAGYSVWFDRWDFKGNFVLEMDRAHTHARRTIAVLSPAYLKSRFVAPEWAARFAEDATSEHDLLVPVRVADFQPTGLLKQIVYVDLIGVDADAAQSMLAQRLQGIRRKPSEAPLFPGTAAQREVQQKPIFPNHSTSCTKEHQENFVDTQIYDVAKLMFENAAARLHAIKQLEHHGLIDGKRRDQAEGQIIEMFIILGSSR